LIGKLEGKTPLRRPVLRRNDTVKIDKKIEVDFVDWIKLDQD
jgi:hypothetical protein